MSGSLTKGRYRRPGVPDCVAPDCENSQWRHEHCRHHWVKMPLEQRFWLEVDRSGDCWTWKGYTRAGYGRLRINYVNLSAHRVAYELMVGPIPPGLVLDHLCGVTACVNPAHLEPVTQAENVSRSHEDRGRTAPRASSRPWRSVSTTCPKGHDLTDPENVTAAPGLFAGVACLTCTEQRRASRRKPEGEPRRKPELAPTCGRGHEFTPENTATYPSRPGHRVCIACQKIRREWRRERRAS